MVRFYAVVLFDYQPLSSSKSGLDLVFKRWRVRTLFSPHLVLLLIPFLILLLFFISRRPMR